MSSLCSVSERVYEERLVMAFVLRLVVKLLKLSLRVWCRVSLGCFMWEGMWVRWVRCRLWWVGISNCFFIPMNENGYL